MRKVQIFTIITKLFCILLSSELLNVFSFHSDIICKKVITYSRVWINAVKVANPARVQLNREKEYSPVPVRA